VNGKPSLTAARAELERALLSMDRLAAGRLLTETLPQGPLAGVEALLVPALEKIGRDWERGEVALSQVYMSGRISEELIEELLPLPPEAGSDGPVIAITMLHDYHLLGKRIVTSMLRANGLAVRDYGRTEVDELVERVRRDQVSILLVSTLMLSSALRVEDVIAGLRESGPAVKVAVGGAPFRFDEQLYLEVGADAYGRNASDALRLVSGWLEGGP
jgi:trimethylamine corrinoid protein